MLPGDASTRNKKEQDNFSPWREDNILRIPPISVSSSLLRPFRVRHVSRRSLRSYYSRTGRPSWPSGTRCRQLHRIEPNYCGSEPILVPSHPPCNPLLKRICRWPADL